MSSDRFGYLGRHDPSTADLPQYLWASRLKRDRKGPDGTDRGRWFRWILALAAVAACPRCPRPGYDLVRMRGRWLITDDGVG